MDSARWLTRRLTAASLAVFGAGLAALLIYCVAEALANPGFSLVDAYWRGRLPWMGIIEGLVVAGATASALAGAVAIWLTGGWLRRVLSVPLFLLSAGWGMIALSPPRRAVPCIDCPPLDPDPWAHAYSVPESAAVFLIAPAVALALLALLRRSHRRGLIGAMDRCR
jgi:hypothetical protein